MMRTAFLAWVTFSVLALTAADAAVSRIQPPNVFLRADLAFGGNGQPLFQLANPCSEGETAITFRLTVTNIGSAPSPAVNDVHAVWVADSLNPAWSAGAPLPSLAAGASAPVAVTLLGLKNPAQMAGRHVFNATINGSHTIVESSYANNTADILVPFPSGFCAPPASIGTVQPQTHPRALTHLPAPSNLTYTVTQAVCAKYGGNVGAFACSIGLPAGKLVLVWDYPPNIAIDGYRIYVIGNSQPVATQSLPAVRLEVLDPPKPGTCFDVTAFRGKLESPHSPTSYCVPN